MPAGRLSLAEQIAQVEEAAPADYDPEDIQSRGAELEDGMQMDAPSREHYFEVGTSSLRNALPSIADQKYEGVRTSRKALLEESEDEEEEEHSQGDGPEEAGAMDDDDEEVISEEDDFGDVGDGEGQHSDEGSPSGNEEEDNEPDEEDEEPVAEPMGPPKSNGRTEGPQEDISSTLKRAREEDLLKGHAVKRQVALWDSLLDTRIRLQKSVVAANRLPLPTVVKDFTEAPECRDSLFKFMTEASLLADELSELQETLLIVNNIVTPPPRKRQKTELESTTEDYSRVCIAATEHAANLEAVFHPYLLQTLSKWSAKIQAVAPSALLPSNRGAFLKGNETLKSAVQLVDESLADGAKLLARTQVPRVKKPRIGVLRDDESAAAEADSDAPDPEMFDDTDFYQKMLRDIIEARGEGNKNEDWALLQKQKKAKKKVDTKASKGRKLRYEVHEKIQNFMVPVPVPGAWHDEQIDELFASLLGKGFENVALNSEEPRVVESIERTGFRVFG